MYRLSLIISEVYNKYLPLAEKGSVSLNLDFSDTTQTVDDPEAIKADLEKHLSSALNRSVNGEISIAVSQDAIAITDSGTTLSKPLCALLSRGRVSVNSRIGFGTTVSISLLPTPKPAATTKPETAPAKPVSSLPNQTPTKPSSSKPSATKPTKTRNTKPRKPSSTNPHKAPATKPTRSQRKLNAAAKKADRKIQKIRKTRKKVIEIS